MSEPSPGTCPGCGEADNYTTPGFTWWGGMVGQRLISHVNCNSCGTGFNSKTGGSNSTAIAIYIGVGVFVLAPAVFCLTFGMLNSI